MKNSTTNLFSMFSGKLMANKRVIMALLSVLVLSNCGKDVSSFDFGKGEFTLFQSGCLHRGTWTNTSDTVQRDVRVDLLALNEDGNTLGESRLTFMATLPDGTSNSREQRIDWKTDSFSGTDMNLSCRGIAQVSAEAYLYD